ncbi:MAG: fibronectin type III domain-containing protein [Cenarchaeum sp. SB0672_bin_9]|nr:fibronectin type III domain-containing protein [Cenarchaeum sp. SB0672_bin_9]
MITQPYTNEPETPSVDVVDSLTAVSVGSNYITVAWPAVEGAISYEIIVTSSGSNGTVKYSTTSDTSFTISGLSPNTDYSIVVLDDLYEMAGTSLSVTTK